MLLDRKKCPHTEILSKERGSYIQLWPPLPTIRTIHSLLFTLCVFTENCYVQRSELKALVHLGVAQMRIVLHGISW